MHQQNNNENQNGAKILDAPFIAALTTAASKDIESAISVRHLTQKKPNGFKSSVSVETQNASNPMKIRLDGTGQRRRIFCKLSTGN